MISVVVPAHNEANVIERCLRSLVEGSADEELEIIVVCNGCTDRTADVAQSSGVPVSVIDTPTPSKANALNEGDRAASGFPRFYVDADIVVSPGALSKVAEVLRQGTALIAAPGMQVNLAGCSWLVRAYYAVWTRLPYTASGMTGSGFYGLSSQGRGRFDRFPDIISDDGYVHTLFEPRERATVEECWFMVRPPRRLVDLIRVKTRVHCGRYELFAQYPERRRNDRRGYKTAILRLLSQPTCCLLLPVYAIVQVTAKVWGYYRHRARKHSIWGRDDSSRSA